MSRSAPRTSGCSSIRTSGWPSPSPSHPTLATCAARVHPCVRRVAGPTKTTTEACWAQKIRDDQRGRVTLTKWDAPQRGRCERRFGRVERASRDGVRRTADDRTAEEDDRRPHDRAVRERPRERSPRPGSNRQGPPDRAPWQRPERLRRAGLVALRMAMVDPEAPASRVVSKPAQVRAQRRRSPSRSEPGTTITTRPSPRGAATSLRDRHARRAGSRRARISPNDEAAGGPSGSSTVESAITAVP